MSKLRVLIADDSKSDRLILQSLLKQDDYAVYVAEDGQEAINIYEQYLPDIVLIDALMPNVDGFEAAKAIKQLSINTFVPVIFITSLTDAKSLARCLEVGGDDFLCKPYNHVILRAKIEAFTRMKTLYATVHQQKQEIEKFHDELLLEQHQAKKIFDNVAHLGCLDDSNISYNINPMSIFNGDILLAAQKPSGSVQIFMGDFTGHSLPAAVGAMPVSEIFYGMTLKGISMEEMLKEINSRLNTILPTGTFCCAVCIEIDYEHQLGQIWNGGLPDAYLMNKEKGISDCFSSKHLPLGVINSKSFNANLEKFFFTEQDSLFVATDGVVESESETGEMFGSSRLLDILKMITTESSFNKVKSSLSEFSKNQTDDVTFLEVSGVKPELITGLVERNHIENKELSWSIDYSFEEESLRNFDPLPLMVQPLMEVHKLRQHRSQIYTILSELYSNALEHGVLQLGSWDTRSAEMFSDYFEHKADKLKQLKKGKIDVEINLNSIGDNVEVIIAVTDSGAGFDHAKKLTQLTQKKTASRGLMLLKELCNNISYNAAGNRVEVKLCWSSKQENIND